MRDLQLPGRSTAHGVNGMAASSHTLSTLTAINILASGGNAVDAAVAATAVQCVVEPMSTGIGGDCFVLYAPGGNDKIFGLNGSGFAPKALTADIVRAAGHDHIPVHSPHAVTVPGAIDAWITLLDKFGTRSLGELLQPAIRFAEDGWAVTPRIATDWQRNEDKMSVEPAAKAQYLKNGKAPKAGERFSLPTLAASLKIIADKGRDGFYAGAIAEDMVSYLQSHGGKHTLDDFAEQHAEWVTPITTDYHGYTVHQIPPNGQGITALMMLNILSGFDLTQYAPNSVDRLHLETEASRLAYAARDHYVADQRQADVPVDKMLSVAFADSMREKINLNKAMDNPEESTGPQYRDTIYLTVVDRDGNTCSFINSLYFAFGSGLVAPKSGIVLQNRGSGFNIKEGHPNCIAPHKRPLHTIIPGMVTRNGKVAYSYGVMGGGYQPVGHSHVLTNMINYGMDPQEALDAPRVFHMGGKLDVERGLSDDIMAGLAQRGHQVNRPEMPWGGGQIIAIDWKNGSFIGGSDPRKDGIALGY